MNTRLFEAARKGDIEDLKGLLRENPLILHTISLFCIDNPLHIASAAGHVGFVNEILKPRPDFARELNTEGFSPMHIAAANGNVEVVRELLKVDLNLCRLEGREKKTPFHFAAIKGKVDVIREMLRSSAECIEDVTIQQEPALHLVGVAAHSAGSLEVNAINQSGLTALDLLQIFPSEAGDLEISETLQRAGAKRARDLALFPFPAPESHNHQTVNVPSETRSALLVIAVLVATATFQVGLSPPGGVWQETYIPHQNTTTTTTTEKSHIAGTSVMAAYSGVTFILFVIFNSIGFSVSLYMISVLTSKFPLQLELQVCIVALFFTYNIQEILWILHTTSLLCIDSPAHIASAAGHVGFVKEITRLRPEFATELNRDGFSPMHLAAAK